MKSKKKAFVSIALIFLLMFSMIGSALAQIVDIEDHWAQEQINSWTAKGLIQGYPDGTFKPDQGINRAEFFTLVNRSLGLQKRASLTFTDVIGNEWFVEQIEKAVVEGYVEGYPDGTIKPYQSITRQEVAVIMSRLFSLESPEQVPAAERFTDYGQIPEWSKNAVKAVVGKGYVLGYPDGSFKPERPITRAETTVLLDRILGTFYNAPGTYGPAEDKEVIDNATISSAGVTLRNITVNGDLHITAGVGEGSVNLNNVEVKGSLLVKGGGEDSVYLDDCTIGNVVVEKADGKVRVVARGNTNVTIVKVKSSAQLETENITAGYDGFVTVYLTTDDEVDLAGDFGTVFIESEGAKVQLLSGTIKKMVASAAAKDATLTTSSGTIISELELNVAVKVVNKGTISKATVNVSGVVFEGVRPVVVSVAEGVEKPTVPSTGGGGGGGGSTPVTTYTVTFVVYDQDFNKVNDAVINFNTVAYTAGQYNINSTSGTYDYQVNKDGYASDFGTVIVNADVTVQAIIVEDASNVEELAAGTYTGNYVVRELSQDTIFGPEMGTANITGTLYLDPGEEYDLTLKNIVADKMIVLSGKSNSITMLNVGVLTVLIISDDTGVRIIAQEGTSIKETKIDKTNPDKRSALVVGAGTSMGKISVNASGELELDGDFGEDEVIVSGDGASISLAQNAKVSSINMAAQGSVKAQAGASVAKLNVTAGKEVAVEGSFSETEVNITGDGATLKLAENTSVGKTNVSSNATISAGAGAKVAEVTITSAAAGKTVKIDTQEKVESVKVEASNARVEGGSKIEVIEVSSGVSGVKVDVAPEKIAGGSIIDDQNVTHEENTVMSPIASPPSGAYATPLTVTLTCDTAGAVIFYTTDGSAPTTGSTEYTGPFTIDLPKTVKAFAVKDGYDFDSAIKTFTYTQAVSQGLSALQLSEGVLAPSFERTRTVYSSTVPYETTAITVTPAAVAGIITVNDQVVTSGGVSQSISLAVGANIITVKVQETGKQARIYTVVVTRQPSVKYMLTLQAVPTTGGTVTGAGEYQAGTEVTITATANTGYRFVNWTKGGVEVSTEASYIYTMPAQAVTLVANFEALYALTLEANPTTGGTVTGAGNYAAGAEVSVSATATTGYQFVNWTKGGVEVSSQASFTYTMPAQAVTLVANFEEVPYEDEMPLKNLGSKGNVLEEGNVYNIFDDTAMGLYVVSIRVSRLPEVFENAEGYVLKVGEKTYTLLQNIFNADIFEVNIPKSDAAEQELEDGLFSAIKPETYLLKELGSKGNVLEEGNVYNIFDDTAMGLYVVSIRVSRLPEVFEDAEGYVLKVGEKTYTLLQNMFNADIFEVNIPKSDATEQELKDGLFEKI